MKRIHASSSWSAALYVSGSMPTETASYCRSSERESRESAVCFLPTYMPGATISVTANGGSVIFLSSVTIAPGTINKTFTINTVAVATTTVRTFTATQGVAQKTATLTISP